MKTMTRMAVMVRWYDAGEATALIMRGNDEHTIAHRGKRAHMDAAYAQAGGGIQAASACSTGGADDNPPPLVLDSVPNCKMHI